jgi:hypothetical protein
MTKYGKLPENPGPEDILDDMVCPECGAEDISHLHCGPTFATDECDYFYCNECGHQWGNE